MACFVRRYRERSSSSPFTSDAFSSIRGCVLSSPSFAGQFRCPRRRMCVVTETSSTPGVKQFAQVPRTSSFPILGSLSAYCGLAEHANVQEACKAGLKLYRTHGPIVVQKIPGRYSLVHLFSAKDFQKVFQEEGRAPFRIGMAAMQHYRDRTSQMYTGASILHIQGERWISVRTAGNPHILRNNAVMSYIPAIDSVARDAVSLIEKSTDDKDEVDDCFHLLRRWALESTMVISIGVRLGCLEAPYAPQSAESEAILDDTMVTLESLQAFCNRFPYYRYFTTPMWRRFQRAMDDYAVRVTKHISDAASRFLNNKQREPRTILEHLLVGNKLNFADMVTFTRDLIMGGIETTASVATACLLDFAKYPEVQERARNEVFAVVGEDVSAIQPEHVDRLPYLNACMKETMRLNPAIMGICRKLQQDAVLSGYLVPAKTTVFLHSLEASRLPEHFSGPDTFLPERWIASQEKCDEWVHSSLASLPFGSGRRTCIGRRIAETELTIILAKILQRYKVEHHHQDVQFHEKLFVIPKEPARLQFSNLRICPHI
ncbi:hypothetical protein V5799_008578 [Amblyomma americanum]|uniref:Cytochrome n=1 Tax=Amblyomma americanum TaxID=6943 RepID=A0AAQ4FEJ0_AMBAM